MRAIGSQISPNGCGLSRDSMISLSLMDAITMIDRGSRTVTTQAGARVKQVTKALALQGLVLQNYASIDDQQMAGFT